jgi:hypothetical protein
MPQVLVGCYLFSALPRTVLETHVSTPNHRASSSTRFQSTTTKELQKHGRQDEL